MNSLVKVPNNTKTDITVAAHGLINPLYTIRRVIDPSELKYKIVTDVQTLKVPCEPWVFDSQESVDKAKELEQNMHDFIEAVSAIGLAHNQIGGNKRVIAVKSLGALFNPKIVHYSPQEIVLEEGCLSFPALYVKVKRPFSIRVRFTMANGQTVTEFYEGMTARIIQHEVDHIDGKLFYEKASKLHSDQAFRKQARELKKLKGKK